MSQVSLVVPAFEEGERLPRVLEALAGALGTLASPVVELVVVDDGSREPHRSAMQ